MKTQLLSQSLIALTLLAGCSKSAPNATHKAPPAVPAASALPQLERDTLSLTARLQREAEDHPQAVQRVASELTALEQAGISVVRKRQVLARMLAADYCESAITGTGLGLAVCVFRDAESAALGRAQSRASFDRMIPGRSLLLRSSALLTITQPPSDAARREAELIGERFTHPLLVEHAAL
jgi:hypothetical protein